MKQLSVPSIVDLNRMKFSEKIKEKLDASCMNQVTNVNIYSDVEEDTTLRALGENKRKSHEKLENKGGCSLMQKENFHSQRI